MEPRITEKKVALAGKRSMMMATSVQLVELTATAKIMVVAKGNNSNHQWDDTV